ncbi:hypothetical protein LPB140_01055 [Sphingorhabdus lutea]|uniref:HpcH/HpaI aldolase/citrate lyase domain-containing protein n=1 Tax=Sphingorhabdus lutea TaxID=1913578 RepID=A0A1L3J964_9SPHN|nr:CoA ester lyase [Sphingorhabdus lutea]APG61658.1 hypothetical protein LPB140_01055 [Sphingorhabdus lutea]
MIAFTNFLFVPANRPERFEKALNSGTDLICIDLEDSVPAAEKETARHGCLAAIKTLNRDKVAIRINSIRTKFGLLDLIALEEAAHLPSQIFIPMVESVEDVAIAYSILGNKINGIVPLIETVKGLSNAAEIAAHPAVTTVMFGGGDFSSELGVKLEWQPLLYARSQLILACAGARKRCVDVPYIDVQNNDGLRSETTLAKQLGFHAKAAIHPKQISAICEIMKPSEEETAHAKLALAAFEAAGRAPILFQGQMLEAPVIKFYENLIRSAGG